MTETEIKPKFGEVYKCAFYGESVGSEVKGHRPVLVVSTKIKVDNQEGKVMTDQIHNLDKQSKSQIIMTIIAFISQKGGVGKSTLAQALASEASQQKIKVLLADCDSQQATNAPARTSQGTLEIAKYADLIIQPTGASRADLIPAVKEFNALAKAKIDQKKLLFVLTRLSTLAEAKAIQEYLKKTGYNCSSYYVMEKASYKQIQNEGESISEVNYKTLQKQVKKLINNKIKKTDLKSLGEAPLEASVNIQAPELAPRDNRFTGRNKRISFTCHPKFAEELRKLAYEENCYQIEVLERALESYKREKK
ncbi:8623_t:CDS:2 [Funneliformis geosporum]|nr:8623_t:CDS:2 [Funneliformis geosporum]